MIQNGEQNFGTSATREDILHIGVKKRSGRYPYGSGNRPFQHVRGYFHRRKQAKIVEANRKKAIEANRRKRESEERLKKSEERLKKFQEDKNRLMVKGTPAEIISNQQYFTNNELQAVLDRFNKLSQLNVYNEQTKTGAFKTIDDLMKKLKNVNDWATTGINTYGNYQKIRKILDGTFDANKDMAGGGDKKKK